MIRQLHRCSPCRVESASQPLLDSWRVRGEGEGGKYSIVVEKPRVGRVNESVDESSDFRETMDVTQRAITRLLPLSARTRIHTRTWRCTRRSVGNGNSTRVCWSRVACARRRNYVSDPTSNRKTSRRPSFCPPAFAPVFLSRACTSLSIVGTPTMTIATVTRSNTARLRKRPRPTSPPRRIRPFQTPHRKDRKSFDYERVPWNPRVVSIVRFCTIAFSPSQSFDSASEKMCKPLKSCSLDCGI